MLTRSAKQYGGERATYDNASIIVKGGSPADGASRRAYRPAYGGPVRGAAGPHPYTPPLRGRAPPLPLAAVRPAPTTAALREKKRSRASNGKILLRGKMDFSEPSASVVKIALPLKRPGFIVEILVLSNILVLIECL